MALIQSKTAQGIIGIPIPGFAGDAIGVRFSHTLLANPSINDILELGCIPAGCRVLDMVIDSDDLDTNGAPTIAYDVGVMSGDHGVNDAARTCGAEFFAASAASQAGTVVRPTIKTAFRTAPTDKDRSIGVKFTAAAATFASGTIGMTVFYATA